MLTIFRSRIRWIAGPLVGAAAGAALAAVAVSAGGVPAPFGRTTAATGGKCVSHVQDTKHDNKAGCVSSKDLLAKAKDVKVAHPQVRTGTLTPFWKKPAQSPALPSTKTREARIQAVFKANFGPSN